MWFTRVPFPFALIVCCDWSTELDSSCFISDDCGAVAVIPSFKHVCEYKYILVCIKVMFKLYIHFLNHVCLPMTQSLVLHNKESKYNFNNLPIYNFWLKNLLFLHGGQHENIFLIFLIFIQSTICHNFLS